ncbi:DMT family transporter [Bacillus litorisediminis]|uniref:DMT family transporter n=1 Tax=Bacillus litorisediminis TaxID=2922713 RepID=UPI001FAC4604|nr:EamA family transporter [Bacillus litorisediminis]
MRLYAALITLSLIWGMSFYFIKVLVEGLGPWGIVFVRCMLGVITLAVIILIQRKKMNWKALPLKPLFIVGLMNALIPWGLIGISETRISSALASIVNATTPIFTSIIGVILFSVTLSIRQWTGILIGFAGILLLTDLNITQLFQEDLIGMGTMILATVCYGFSSQYSKRHLQDVSVMMVALMTLLTGAIGSLVMMAMTDSFFPLNETITWNSILAMIGLGFFGSGLAYLLFYYLIKEGSAEFATFVTYLVPITAMFWGWFLLDEQIPPLAFGGLALILAGVFLSTRKSAKKVHDVDHAVSSAKSS